MQRSRFPLVSLLKKSADARSASGRFSRALVEGDTAWSGGATVPPDASTCGAIFNGLIGRHFVIGIAEQQFSGCDPGHRSEVTCPNAVALATGPELTAPTGQRRAINKRRFRNAGVKRRVLRIRRPAHQLIRRGRSIWSDADHLPRRTRPHQEEPKVR